MTQETKESSVITAAQIQFEHLRESLGIGRGRPRLSWRVEAGPKDWLQQAYEIEAFDAEGQPLRRRPGGSSRTNRCWWTGPSRRWRRASSVAVRVRVWGADGAASDWSEPATVEAGLLDPAIGRRVSSPRIGTKIPASPSPARCCGASSTLRRRGEAGPAVYHRAGRVRSADQRRRWSATR